MSEHAKEPRGTYREADGRPVPMAESRPAWIQLAYEELERVARRYHETITYGECGQRGQPVLTSLCVHEDGTIGDGYSWATRDVYGFEPEDLEVHAAEERLKCHTFFGADLPPDGGRPAFKARVAAKRRAQKAANAKPSVCPICFLVRSSSGTCGCD